MKVAKDYTFNENRDLKPQVRRLDANLKKLFDLAQGRIRFGRGNDGDRGENLQGEFQVFTSNATPDTEDTIAHTVGAVPVGYIVLKQDKAGSLYLGSTAWTSTNVYFKSDVASVAFTVFLIQ